MGYVKKNKMLMTDDGRPYTYIGRYKVIKESEHMTGIYEEHSSDLLTSKPKWSQAVKLANLLNEAFTNGYEHGMRDANF